MKGRTYFLTDETVDQIYDALADCEARANNGSTEPEDDNDKLASTFSRIQRILLHAQKRQGLIDGEETPGYDYQGRAQA
jgi:hypothetical protein